MVCPVTPIFWRCCIKPLATIRSFPVAFRPCSTQERLSSFIRCLSATLPETSNTEGNAPEKWLRQITAATAAVAWAFFVPAQAYSVILMPTAWFVFVFWFVVWRLVDGNTTPTRAECSLLGLLLGITATAVANVLLLVPLVIAALILKRQSASSPHWRSLSRRATLLLVGVAVGTAPCWIHNYFVAKDPVFLSAHGGVNFWIGNNPLANGYPQFPPGLHAGQAAMLQDSIARAEAAAEHSLKHGQVSAYWSARTQQYISNHPGDWLKLVGLKARNFWSAFQYDDLSVITNLREQGVIFPGCYFGLVSVLALPGLLLAVRLSPKSRWIAAAVLLAMLGLLTIFITERYRLVAVPGLLVLGAYGLFALWRSCTSAQLGTIAAYLALLGGSLILVCWPQWTSSLWALDAYNSGWQALESNNLALAEKKLAIAYAYVPTNSETNFALGNLRLGQNKIADAKSFYAATLRFDPDHKGALNNLGVIALNGGLYDEAENWFERAENVDQRDAKTHFLLAKVLLIKGQVSRALNQIDLAVAAQSGQAEFQKLRQQILSAATRSE